MNVLEVRNLSKVYGKGESRVDALKNINFNIEKGEFVAIVGESGSGKSTLLHLLGGLDRATSGEIIIENEDILKLKDDNLAIFRRRSIGFVFQFFNLIPILNVEENIKVPVLLDSKKVDESYFEEILKILGLDKRRKHIPAELSGGQQQRVSIARSLINKPGIILADEPTGNLDSKTSKEIIELLQITSKKYNQTLIVITHDLKIAEKADKVITIEDGEIVKIACKKGVVSLENL
ncbi:ABC transporter ATP-binding protein [uncultured Clostridium sp.]|jgi:putative ABC transport system ATP-binding protein|uniref:ABC transporter ATP-binding protein n=1 Tax=uncultured Clostridium sp. TaxID=59620 RepID=UPI00261066EE|nr:ABC transporter ATP-binding protein [uncultured Clostridium sp.]